MCIKVCALESGWQSRLQVFHPPELGLGLQVVVSWQTCMVRIWLSSSARGVLIYFLILTFVLFLTYLSIPNVFFLKNPLSPLSVVSICIGMGECAEAQHRCLSRATLLTRNGLPFWVATTKCHYFSLANSGSFWHTWTPVHAGLIS